MAVKVTDGDAHYYRAETKNSVEAFAKAGKADTLTQAQKDAIAKILASGAEEVTGLDAIREMTTFLSTWSRRVTSTQDARRVETIDAINAGEDLEEVQLASGVTWNTIAAWAFPVKKSSTVDGESGAAINRILETIKDKKEADKQRGADAKDPSSNYAQMLVNIENAKREFETTSGEKYKEGEGMDETIDAMVKDAYYFHGPRE